MRAETAWRRPSGAPLPHARIPPKVRDGEDDRALGLDDEEHAEGEPAQYRTSDLAEDDREALRPVLDSRERRLEFSEELRSKAGALALVPGARVEGRRALPPAEPSTEASTGGRGDVPVRVR
jgi:hypothetical protein